MPLTLRWRAATSLPVDGQSITPETLARLSPAEVATQRVRVGNGEAEIGHLFDVAGDVGDGRVVLEGDLTQVGRIGRRMSSGSLTIHGDAGAELGAEMSGGTIAIEGAAGDWAGAEMRGGVLRIRGHAGRFLGAAYPGSRLGMREGIILVEGAVGDDAGLAMRRGLIAIAGTAGDGLGQALVAGSIFAFGAVGRRLGAGMRRGSLVLFGLPDPSNPGLLPTFAPSGRLRPPFVDIYLRRLHTLGFPVPIAAVSGALSRYNGDLVERGQGEVLVWG